MTEGKKKENELIAITEAIMSGLSGYLAAELTADDEMEATDIVRRIISAMLQDLQEQVEFWQQDSAKAWDTCEARRLEAEELRALIDTPAPPTPAEPAGDALRTIEGRMDRMIRDGFHRVRYVEGFPHDESQLVMPLNDPDNGAIHCVASLSVEDSGIGPALWNLALDMLSLRAALAAAPQPEVVGRADNMPLADMARAESFRTLARCIRDPSQPRKMGLPDLAGVLAWEERRVAALAAAPAPQPSVSDRETHQIGI